ncbi:MAG TPA: AAA family ATPase, partial [Actinomycetota bacterium]|nr:AAA family ATPase [Actinomycetota bacterium]
SRLVAELEDEEHALVVSGRCLPYGDGITYWPLAEIVQKTAAIESGDAAEVARDRIAASAGGDDEAVAIAERVAQVVGLSEAGGTNDDLFWAIRKYFERLAAQRPLVVVFDDVHWAEATMLELIDHLVDTLADVPLLVVCMARLDLLEVRPTWGGGKLNASTLVLGPLKEADCRALVGSLLGESPSLGQVTDAIFPVADGNPLFVEEMVSMLVDNGLLDRVEGQWRATRELASLDVPPTIQALVSARLDHLDHEEREVVGIAAVMGKVFVPRALTDLASPSVGDRIDEALGRLTRKQLVTPGDVEFAGTRMYSFRHQLIRDTAYEHLPRMTRAAIHERYADWLVKVLGERIAEYDEIVGYHLEQAHRYQTQVGGLTSERRDLASRAAERLAEGGRRALARQDAAAAVKLLSRAAELAAGDDEERLGVLPDLGRALYETGEYEAAIEAFEDGIDLATESGDEIVATRCRIFREMARIHRDPRVNAEESLHVAERAVETLGPLGDDYGTCYAWNLLAYIHDSAGRSNQALMALRHASDHAERSGITSTIAHQKRALLRSLAWGSGTVSEILPLARDLLVWSRARHDRYSESRALLTLAQAHAMLGDFERARAYIGEQEAACADVSLQFVNSWGAFEKAQVELLRADLESAEAHARAGSEFLERKGERAMLPTLQTLLADILYMQGDLSGAGALVDAARSISTDDDALTEMKWRSVLAKVSAREGATEPAVALAREAVSLGAPTGYLDWYAGVVADLGDVMATVGRSEESAEAFVQAAELFARKGNIVAEQRARDAARRAMSV